MTTMVSTTIMFFFPNDDDVLPKIYRVSCAGDVLLDGPFGHHRSDGPLYRIALYRTLIGLDGQRQKNGEMRKKKHG